MNLIDLIKKHYLILVLIAVIAVLGTALVVNHYRQPRPVNQFEGSEKKRRPV